MDVLLFPTAHAAPGGWFAGAGLDVGGLLPADTPASLGSVNGDLSAEGNLALTTTAAVPNRFGLRFDPQVQVGFDGRRVALSGGADAFWIEYIGAWERVRLRLGLDTPAVGLDGVDPWERTTRVASGVRDASRIDTFAGLSLVLATDGGWNLGLYGGLPAGTGNISELDTSRWVGGFTTRADLGPWSTWNGAQLDTNGGLDVELSASWYPLDLLTVNADGVVGTSITGEPTRFVNAVQLVFAPRAVVAIGLRGEPGWVWDEGVTFTLPLSATIAGRFDCARLQGAVAADPVVGTHPIFSLGLTMYVDVQGDPTCGDARLLDGPHAGAFPRPEPDLALTGRRLFGGQP